MKKIVIVDDQKLMRIFLRTLIANDPALDVVAEAASGEEAISICKELQPDVILLDIMMPGIGGVLAASRIRRFFPDIDIIVISAINQEAFAYNLLEIGVKGFLSKNCEPQEILDAIHSISGDNLFFSRDVAQQLALSMKARKNDAGFGLSARELEVLLLVVKGSTTGEIAEYMHLSPKTVTTYRNRFKKKLGVPSEMALAIWAIQHNLIELKGPLVVNSYGGGIRGHGSAGAFFTL